MQLPNFVNTDRVIAHVAWDLADESMKNEQSIKAARVALRRYMRAKHPGKKYRCVQTFSLNGKTAAWMAVPLDG